MPDLIPLPSRARAPLPTDALLPPADTLAEARAEAVALAEAGPTPDQLAALRVEELLS